MTARIVFMGSPQFAVPSLRALRHAGYQVVLAVTQPDKSAGRGNRLHASAVKLAAAELGVEVFQPGRLRDEAAQERLRSVRAEVFVVAAYGKILPQAVLDIPPSGCLNVHASLLPRWRGPSPISAAVLAGDDQTGVSIMQLARKMDAGPVLSRVAETILPDDTTGSLEPRLAQLGALELARVLPAWLAGDIKPEPQGEPAASYCHLLSKEDGRLRAEMTAVEAERAVRAYNPWPVASVVYRGERLAIWQASLAGSDAPPELGALTLVGRSPAVAFRDGLLVLREVQRAGGKHITGEQFLAGERGELAPEVILA